MKPTLFALSLMFAFASPAWSAYDLDFSKQTGRTQTAEVNGQTITFRAYENIVYVQKPVDTQYQTLNIYIPEAYFQQGKINGFNAQTAPIFSPTKWVVICQLLQGNLK